jgi:hypothetical protein
MKKERPMSNPDLIYRVDKSTSDQWAIQERSKGWIANKLIALLKLLDTEDTGRFGLIDVPSLFSFHILTISRSQSISSLLTNCDTG